MTRQLITNGTLVERVVAEVREAILEGELEPGSHVPQKALASKFGTSRHPVREALRELQSEGLVVLKPNAGARVVPLTLRELKEVYLMRERLEPLLLGESIPHLGADEIAGLGRAVDEMEQIATEGDRWREWLEIDHHFHYAALVPAPMPRLLGVVRGLWNVAVRYRRAYTDLWLPAHLGVQHAEHRLLLHAIERGDATDAAQLLEMHIRRTRIELTEHPEIFDDSTERRATRRSARSRS